MKEEIWKDIAEYEGLYQVSNLGHVRSLDRVIKYTNRRVVHAKSKIISGFIKKNGYISVDLYKDNKRKKFHLHRLVGAAFIPNPENKPQINHKDENKSNNSVDNLEWMTAKENINYGTRKEKHIKATTNHPSSSKSISQYTLTGELIEIFPSAKEIERALGFPSTSIIRCCRHRKNIQTCHGFKWEYNKNEVKTIG